MKNELSLTQIPIAMRKITNDHLTQSDDRILGVRVAAVKLKELVDISYVELSRVLFEIRSKHYYEKWGYDNFGAYVNDELGFSRSKAVKLTEVYKQFRINLGVRVSDIEGVGWTKMHALLPITKQSLSSSEASKWVNRAKTLPITKLKEAVAKKTGNGRVNDEYQEYKTSKETFEVKLGKDQWKTVKHALTIAEKKSNTPHVAVNLEWVALNFIHAHLELATDSLLKVMLSSIQRHFGVGLIAVKGAKVDEINKILKKIK